MKKILSAIFIVFAMVVLVSCNTNMSKVTGTKITNVEERNAALSNLSDVTSTAVVGNTVGLEFDVTFKQTAENASTNFSVDGGLFITVAEKMEDFKLHAELDFSTSMPGMDLNGSGGFYAKDESLYVTGLAKEIFPFGDVQTFAELDITAENYNTFIDSILNQTLPESEEMDIVIPFELQEILDLLIEHDMLLVYKDGNKFSFVLDVNLEKLELLATSLNEEEFDVSAIEKLDLNLTVIINDNKLQHLSISGDLAFTIPIAGDLYLQATNENKIELNFDLKFVNNAKMPAFPSFN